MIDARLHPAVFPFAAACHIETVLTMDAVLALVCADSSSFAW